MDGSRTARRLAVFAVIGALGFGGGYALAQAFPGDPTDDAPHTSVDHGDMNHSDTDSGGSIDD